MDNLDTASQAEQPVKQTPPTLTQESSSRTSSKLSKLVVVIIILILIVTICLGFYYILGAKVIQQKVTSTHPTVSSTAPLPSPTQPSTQTNTGISGTIIESPTCPGPQRPGQICEKPYQTTMLVKSMNQSQTITQFTSDSQGKFQVTLPPGTYLLVPKNTTMFPRSVTQQVIVQQGKISNVVINFDTGLR